MMKENIYVKVKVQLDRASRKQLLSWQVCTADTVSQAMQCMLGAREPGLETLKAYIHDTIFSYDCH